MMISASAINAKAEADMSRQYEWRISGERRNQREKEEAEQNVE